ncbi:MAG: riboflavin synthase [Gammaproteobacteria bacterium]|nr:riboflavin synthase [Gammaproteobacteria bacterium]
MFSGIIETVANLSVNDMSCSPRRLCFETQFDIRKWLSIGRSIAVDGVCLTVVEIDSHYFCVEASAETLSCTTLKELNIGAKVNIEPALAATDRFDGHLVSGHVDGVGTVVRIEDENRTRWLHIEAPDHLIKYIAPKGSVCVNGTSLVSHKVEDRNFHVNLIPHTLAVTNFADKKVGDHVNIEVDLIARYIERLSESWVDRE